MRRPLRILHVLNSPNGGATHCALDIVSTLKEQGYQSFVITPAPFGAAQAAVCRSAGAEWRVVPMMWWNRKTRLSPMRRLAISAKENLNTALGIRSVLEIRRLIREWQIDLVHSHTALIPWGAIAAKLLGVRHIWHIHEPNGSGYTFNYWFSDNLLANFIQNWSDHIILASKYVGEIFNRYPRSTPKTVLYQGIEVGQFNDTEAGKTLREKLNIEASQLLIGMVGNPTSTWKRHELFIETAAILQKTHPQLRFAIFGTLPKQSSWLYNTNYEYAISLQKLVEARGLTNRFIWAGHHANVGAIMNAIDILVHPCEQEGFGRIAIEAMAAGRPVVGPQQGGIAESVLDGETGLLVPPNSADALASACQKLIASPELRQQFGNAGKAWVRSNFDLQQSTDGIIQIYRSVLNR